MKLRAVPEGRTLCRFAISLVVVYVCWDIKPIFYALWGMPPIRWLMVYTDPRHPGDDPLHGGHIC